MSTVLVVEDERGVREGLGRAIEKLGHKPLLAAGIAEAKKAIEQGSVDCVLLDIRLKDGDGLTLLREIREGALRELPVIVATAYGDSERTIQAMRDGAFDYLTKPFDLPHLLATVDRAIKQANLARGVASQPPAPSAQGPLVGTSAAMLQVWKVIGRAAASSAPVLITGETGTGKELVAQAVHQYSSRAREPFVAVNLAALVPTLIESELMGHEKGSFTGASARHAGKLEQAGQGTLFLDEIGDLDASLQTKLLRVLQEGEYERVGGTSRLTSGARIVAATNKPARPGQPGATLREELYYRLAVIEIEVPPLRARKSDIPLLVAHALEGAPVRAVSEDAMGRLLAYGWPGNVRELVHVIKRAAVMCGGEVIDVHDLPPTLAEPSVELETSRPDYEGLQLREAVAAFEKRLILRALDGSGGNRAEAARRLGIARPQLYAKMEELGIATRQEK
ncbi:MAG: sigma-54-dependent Fis family transcriptional regulator [Deltaproteobacteria bacterium]|nr:sigma-54-dependent Fis family transcriptional regulator [Deltaproteobacteria bacterium]